jgi:hypothetical protein
MSGNLILPILKNIQNQNIDTKLEIQKLRKDVSMQFSSLNEKLNGHFISEHELRNEVNGSRERLQ